MLYSATVLPLIRAVRATDRGLQDGWVVIMLPIPRSAAMIATILEACCIPLLLLLFEVHARTREPETTEIPR